MPKISVVSPVYKAESCIHELCTRLVNVLSKISEDFEIILIEDGSPDKSWEKMVEASKNDPRIHSLKLVKNFGQHSAITAGIDIASGDWVVVMDCDLQDPPEEILNLYSKANQGFHVVVACFTERSEKKMRQFISMVYWKILSYFSGMNFDNRVGNFRIMSRQVINDFRLYREHLRFLGGIISLMGYKQEKIYVKRDIRFAGRTSYSLKKLLSVSLSILVAYSDKPLKISIFIGFLVTVISFFLGIINLIVAISGKVSVPGWASVIISLYFVGGIILMNLGIIGIYLARTYNEAKRRPVYLVEKIESVKLKKENIAFLEEA